MIGQMLNQYALREKIGSGGMGDVYHAWDTRLERDVALKLLPAGALANDAARRAFHKEALSLSKLNHPNIAIVHDFHTCDGIDYLVMEFIQGETLAACIRNGPLPPADAAEIAAQIASALEEAHEHAIIHRDLKPGNVMLNARGRVKVLDFGLAQLHRQSDPEATATMGAHAVAGTLPYMSPEQLRGESLDPRSDIFSLGVLLYEIACGVRPFRHGNALAIAADIMNRAPQPPSELNPQISPALESIILRCLSKDRGERYSSARELESDLRGLRSAGQASAPATELNPARESLVVLPTKVFAPAADAFLADAIPSFLSTYLNRVDAFETKAPPTSFDLERVNGDLTKVAEAYQVSTLVVTLVTVQTRRLVLNAQLVEARTRRMIWSSDFEGPRSQYQKLLREAAEGIRRAMSPSTGGWSIKTAPTAEMDLVFQRGLYRSTQYMNRRRPEDFQAAQADFIDVFEKAPRRADAAAELARLHQAHSGFDAEQSIPAARKWALQALEIDPRCGRAWSVLAVLEKGDYRRQLECALKGAACALRDPYCQLQLSQVIARSSYSLSFEASRQASRVDPLMVRAPLVDSYLAAGLGRFDEAIGRVEDALRIEPENPIALLTRSHILILVGRHAEALALIAMLDAHAAAGRLQIDWVNYTRDLVTVLQGDTAAIERLEAAATGRAPFFGWETMTTGVAGILCRAGHLKAAMRVLETRNRIGLVDPYDYLLNNPDLAMVRADPRFAEIAAPARAGFATMIEILSDAEMARELPSYLAEPVAELRRQAS